MLQRGSAELEVLECNDRLFAGSPASGEFLLHEGRSRNHRTANLQRMSLLPFRSCNKAY